MRIRAETIQGGIFSTNKITNIGTRQQLSLDIEKLSVGDVSVAPVAVARNLGTWFDTNLSLVTHITKTCKATFYHLHNIRRIRKFITVESTKVLVHAFITDH